MCGIAGIYHLNETEVFKEDLIRFTDAMFHRGPDASGYELFSNNTLGLGQRRLSILDLSELGKQPMTYANNRYWITYNGEIFNFEEIKLELRSKGYVFRSETDTEMILAAYTEWGKECLSKFNGMWAMAIWDNIEKELFLSRDRFGIKPLYYLYEPGKRFAFASETRAFKFLNNYSRHIDPFNLELNLKDPYALEGLGYTIFTGIYQLLPGHFMVIKLDNVPQQRRWWNIFENIKSVSQKFEEQAEQFYEILRDACRIRLVSDVPIATALSGGLDSSSIYSTVFDILQKEHPERVASDAQRAFTAVFPGLPQDEAEFAAKAVSYTGGPIQYINEDQYGLSENIIKETELCDFINNSPICSISSVYKGMNQNGIVVSLDGHGVDEMMFGYRDMVYSLYNYNIQENNLSSASIYKDILGNLYHKELRDSVIKKLDKEISNGQESSFWLTNKIKDLIKRKPSEREFIISGLKSLSDKPYNFSNLPLPDRMLYHETFIHTLPALLRNFDRAGMINSVEIRMPFMDWRLVSYIFSLPESSKIGDGFTKRILREAMKNRMEESLRTRTFKVGIASPVEYWFNGILKEWVMDMVKDNTLRTKANQFLEKDGKWTPEFVRNLWQSINVDLIK